MKATYPTGDKLVDELCEFVAARLPKPPPAGARPCLDEDWWVADRMSEGRQFPSAELSVEEGLRFCYRSARAANVERIFSGGAYLRYGGHAPGENAAADLLLYQCTELLATMFGEAASVGVAQHEG